MRWFPSVGVISQTEPSEDVIGISKMTERLDGIIGVCRGSTAQMIHKPAIFVAAVVKPCVWIANVTRSLIS